MIAGRGADRDDGQHRADPERRGPGRARRRTAQRAVEPKRHGAGVQRVAPRHRPLDQAERGRHERRVDDRPERRACPARGSTTITHERQEVVAEPEQQRHGPPIASHGRPPGPEPAGVDLDGQQDAEVVEQRRDRRPAEHLQVGHAEVLGDDERRRAERRRRQDRADPGRGQHAARLLAPGSRPAAGSARRPRRALTAVAVPEPETVPSRKPDSGHGPSRRACATAGTRRS